MRSRASTGGSTSLVDIEIAPAAPKAEHLPDEIVRQYPETQQTQSQTAQNDETTKPASGYGEQLDAAPPPDAEQVADERVDARRRRRADAADQVALMDAAPGGDAEATAVAVGGDGGFVPGDGGTVASTDPGSG